MKSKDIDILCGVTLACAIIVSCGQFAIRNQPPVVIKTESEPQYNGVHQNVTIEDYLAAAVRRNMSRADN